METAVELAFGTEFEAASAVFVKLAGQFEVERVTGNEAAELMPFAVAHTISTPQVSPTIGSFKQTLVSHISC